MSLQTALVELRKTQRLVEGGELPLDEVLVAWLNVAQRHVTSAESAANSLIPLAADLCAAFPSISDEIFAEVLRPLYALEIDGWNELKSFIGKFIPHPWLAFLPQSVSRAGIRFLTEIVADKEKLKPPMQVMYDAEKLDWAAKGLGVPPVPALLRDVGYVQE